MTAQLQAVSVFVVGIVAFLLGVASGASFALHRSSLGLLALVLSAAAWVVTFMLARQDAPA